MNMTPLPNGPLWDATRASCESLPKTPTSPEALEAKRKNRSQKTIQSPQMLPLPPLSPLSIDESKEEKKRQKQSKNKKQTVDSPSVQQPHSPPSLSSGRTPPTTPRTSKSSNRNRSVSNRSPKTEIKYLQVAADAADAASLRRHIKPKKKLHWNNSVRVKVVHNLGSYTPQEKLESWFSADDYSMMEDECELTSIHMDEIEFEHESLPQEEKIKTYKRTLPAGFCERGLESWTMHGEELKEHQVQLVIDTVWQAQIDAWEFLGNHPSKATDTKKTDNKSKNAIHKKCWEFIQQKASEVSMPSTVRAQELAIKDEQMVDSYLNSVRSLEQSRRRITDMIGGKHCSSRSINKSSRTLTTAKSCRTLATVCSSGSRSACGTDNLKSIMKSSKPKRSYSNPKSVRRSPSQPPIVPGKPRLRTISDGTKDDRGSFRILLPKIGNDCSSLRSKSLRSNNSMRTNSMRSNNSMRSSSMRSNSMRSNSLRSNNSRNNSVRSNSVRGNSVCSNSLRSNISRSNSLRSNSVRSSNSLRSNVSRSNSLRSNSVRSSNSLLSNASKNQKKIRFKPKSKTKIPTSPVGSVSNSMLSSHDCSDEDSLSLKMMRSHMSMSLGSEGSSRRRMLRASIQKPLL